VSFLKYSYTCILSLLEQIDSASIDSGKHSHVYYYVLFTKMPVAQCGALSSDDDVHQAEIATPAERNKWGLTKGPLLSRKNVEVKMSSGRWRGAFAARSFHPGDFVCEYQGVVKPKEESIKDEQEYGELGLGCYCLDVEYKGQIFTIDATDSINDPGRYINHASKNANLVKMRPVVTGVGKKRKPRVGLTAARTIKKGEELFFGYGIRDKELPWTFTDAAKALQGMQLCVSILIHDYICIYYMCLQKTVSPHLLKVH